MIMRKVISATVSILLMSLVFVACEGRVSPDRQSDGRETTGPGGGHVPADARGASSFDPEQVFLDFIERLGYERSGLFIVQVEVNDQADPPMWEVAFEDSFGSPGYAMIPHGAEGISFIKFFTPPGAFAPETVQAGDDLADRISLALGLADEGYETVTWPYDPYFTELRSYDELGEHRVCTRYVFIILNEEQGGLKAIHFLENPLPADAEIRIDTETAVGVARGHVGDPGLGLVHAELIALTDRSSPEPETRQYWEIVLDDSAKVYIDAVDGSVGPDNLRAY